MYFYCKHVTKHPIWLLLLVKCIVGLCGILVTASYRRAVSFLYRLVPANIGKAACTKTVQQWYWPETVKLYTIQAAIKPVPGLYHDVC